MAKIMCAREAVSAYVQDGMTLGFSGFLGSAHAEEVTKQIGLSFLETGHPRNLTALYAAGQGDGVELGLNHLGEEGLLRRVIGGHWGLVPRLQKLALENKLAAYNLPQGVISHLFREIAAGRPGVLTHVGLKTFADPRLEGGKLNDAARESGDLVELIHIGGEEKLFYKALPVDVAVIRATYADTAGNCTMEHEGVTTEALSIAQAAKNSGGRVIVQVKQIVEHGTLDPRLVKIPGICVDAIVVAAEENHKQTYGTFYNPAYSGQCRVPVDSLAPMALGARKIIARRAAMELVPNAVVNLGIGMPEGVASVAAEEGLHSMVLTTESGTIGGIPAGGKDFGVTTNADCILDEPYQFDFYDGGGLDIAFLGLAQMDRSGNINVSRFGPKIAGCGGFINISQNARTVVFCGTFTAGGLKVDVSNGELRILSEGTVRKLIDRVEHLTFSGEYSQFKGQQVLYITERAVFKLTERGVELTEIAPGVDLKRDILGQMDFVPLMTQIKQMDPRIFQDQRMGLQP